MIPLTEETVYDHICWSADVDNLTRLLDHLEQMPELKIVKIDRLFVARNGYDVFGRLNARGIKVFYDAKLVEIPPKLEELALTECLHDPWMLNCMAESVSNGAFELTGTITRADLDGLKRFADVCHSVRVRPCGVTVLTTKSAYVTNAEYHERTRIEQVLFYVEALDRAGFMDIVCSPDELLAIRAVRQFDHVRLITPGVRPAGANKDDQVNAKTPRAALEAGSDMLVIGRPITVGNPAFNLNKIVAEILAT